MHRLLVHILSGLCIASYFTSVCLFYCWPRTQRRAGLASSNVPIRTKRKPLTIVQSYSPSSFPIKLYPTGFRTFLTICVRRQRPILLSACVEYPTEVRRYLRQQRFSPQNPKLVRSAILRTTRREHTAIISGGLAFAFDSDFISGTTK